MTKPQREMRDCTRGAARFDRWGAEPPPNGKYTLLVAIGSFVFGYCIVLVVILLIWGFLFR